MPLLYLELHFFSYNFISFHHRKNKKNGLNWFLSSTLFFTPLMVLNWGQLCIRYKFNLLPLWRRIYFSRREVFLMIFQEISIYLYKTIELSIRKLVLLFNYVIICSQWVIMWLLMKQFRKICDDRWMLSMFGLQWETYYGLLGTIWDAKSWMSLSSCQNKCIFKAFN